MKILVASVITMLFSISSVYACEAHKVEHKPVENTNCVKKGKDGKCPPLPTTPKPTPKKKVE